MYKFTYPSIDWGVYEMSEGIGSIWVIPLKQNNIISKNHEYWSLKLTLKGVL